MERSYLRELLELWAPNKALAGARRKDICTVLAYQTTRFTGMWADTSRAISSLTGLGPSLLSFEQTLASSFTSY